MWRLFYGSEVHSLLITFWKESMKVKKSIKSQPVRYMCHADTCVPHEIRDEWILIGGHSWCKKMCPLIRDIHIFKSWSILVLFSKIYYFYTYIWARNYIYTFIYNSWIWGSQGKWKTSGSLWTKKRKKEMMLNCCNLKCFKTEYQLVKSIIKTLF